MQDTYAGLKLITAPASEPITIAQAEAYLRVDTDLGGPVDQDIQSMISTARQICENVMRRGLLTQTWQLSLMNWPGRDYQNWQQNSAGEHGNRFDHIKLPYAWLIQEVLSVTYQNTDATVLTMPPGNIAGGYNVDPHFEPARIVLPYSQIWPTDILLPGAAIQIQYTLGATSVEDLQAKFEGFANLTIAMNRLVAYFFENKVPPDESRKSSVPAGVMFVVEELLTPYRIFV